MPFWGRKRGNYRWKPELSTRWQDKANDSPLWHSAVYSVLVLLVKGILFGGWDKEVTKVAEWAAGELGYSCEFWKFGKR